MSKTKYRGHEIELKTSSGGWFYTIIDGQVKTRYFVTASNAMNNARHQINEFGGGKVKHQIRHLRKSKRGKLFLAGKSKMGRCDFCDKRVRENVLWQSGGGVMVCPSCEKRKPFSKRGGKYGHKVSDWRGLCDGDEFCLRSVDGSIRRGMSVDTALEVYVNGVEGDTLQLPKPLVVWARRKRLFSGYGGGKMKKISNLNDERVDEIFKKVQDEHGITEGDVDPYWDMTTELKMKEDGGWTPQHLEMEVRKYYKDIKKMLDE
jgi:hypothetical protein